MLFNYAFSNLQPWIFTEIKEQRHWDISSGERLNILKDYVHFGLEHWGSDSKGIYKTTYVTGMKRDHLCLSLRVSFVLYIVMLTIFNLVKFWFYIT